MLIPTKKNIATVTDLRTRTIELLKEVEKEGVRYVFQRSDPKAVLLSMKRYEEMMEDFEALSSVNFREKIKKARKTKTYTSEQVKKMLDL